MKPAEQRDFCKTIVRSTGRLGGGKLGYFDVRGRECLLRCLSNFGTSALTTSVCIARELAEGRPSTTQRWYGCLSVI